MRFFSKILHSKLLKGTVILTGASFLTRIIGFLYRMYIAQFFLEEGMGIIQLSFPIVVLFFSICAAGTQAAISRYTAASHHSIIYFCSGCLLGFAISFGCSLFLYINAKWIAIAFLKESRCAPLLRIHALSLPFATLHACLNGYFIGLEKASYPAISQVLEQITRVGFVYFFITFAVSKGIELSLSIVILGSFIGEVASSLFSLTVFFFHLFTERSFSLSMDKNLFTTYSIQFLEANKKILSHAVPITTNRILINCLNSLEATLIPQQLILYGLSKLQALSLFGVFTGMALPLIQFPASITSAICILLLPKIAKEQSLGHNKEIKHIVFIGTLMCTLVGLGAALLFIPLGPTLGVFLFHSSQAGYYIRILGFLCPILYLPAILQAMLNGLGFVKNTLLHQILSLAVRLIFVKWCIPKYSLYGYLCGLFISQLLLTALNFLALHKYIVYNKPGFIRKND